MYGLSSFIKRLGVKWELIYKIVSIFLRLVWNMGILLFEFSMFLI